MTNDSGQTTSVWMHRTQVQTFSPLDRDLLADICVIGGGMAGLTTAYLLAREGRRPVLIDDGPTAGGETARTTAHLAWALDDRYYELERMLGLRACRLAGLAHQAAIARIELAVREENIDCDFERLPGYLFNPPGEQLEDLDRELDTCHRAGFTDVRFVPRAPIDAFDTGRALEFPHHALFHPLRYLSALAAAITRLGGQIFNGTRVVDIADGYPAEVHTASGHVVRAQAVVVATNSPISDRVSIHTKQSPYRTYVVGLTVPKGAVHNALYWDTLEEYHYVRLERGQGEDADHDILIVGGEDHKTGQAYDMDDRYRRLEAWTRERFPQCREVFYRWSGQVMETLDGLAYIGRDPRWGAENVYIATGDSGQGMTHGTLAGIILTDLIQNRPNPWSKLFNPARKTVRAAREYVSENLNVARQYADYLKPGTVSSADELQPGDGALMQRGPLKVALYKDEAGAVHECSAVCPHMGCIVHWNPGEKTWDCPCHGSRYDAVGRALNGPTVRDLASVHAPAAASPHA